MRHFDIDQQRSFRTWPHLLAPKEAIRGGGSPRPVAHALRGVLLVAGRLLEGIMVAAAGMSAPLLADGAAPAP
ncbi:MAG: hypothetical protein K2X44_01665, partial [Magnetospirillum sp.]|nr:hypothetical protein [Magnetospirillum sp.]